MAASVDVIIVTYQSAGCVAQAVASVRAASSVRRIVVVDNASADGSAERAEAAGPDTVIRNATNRGFAEAVGQGLAECRAEYTLLPTRTPRSPPRIWRCSLRRWPRLRAP